MIRALDNYRISHDSFEGFQDSCDGRVEDLMTAVSEFCILHVLFRAFTVLEEVIIVEILLTFGDGEKA